LHFIEDGLVLPTCDAPVLAGRKRSNPHRSAILLIGISTFPRFPPSALAQRLPSHLSVRAGIRVHGQASSNP
jgi:hypothetical protein